MTDFTVMGKSVSASGYYNSFARKVPFVRNSQFQLIFGKNVAFVNICLSMLSKQSQPFDFLFICNTRI